MEEWKVGRMEEWNVGMLECWNVGRLHREKLTISNCPLATAYCPLETALYALRNKNFKSWKTVKKQTSS